MRPALTLAGLFWLLLPWLPAQIPFYEEDFSGTGLPTGWETTDNSGNPPALLINWEKCEAGDYCPPLTYNIFTGNFDDQPFGSSTAANGYVFADSDGTNLPAGTNPHLIRLSSSAIDCSNRDEVILYFETWIGRYNFDVAENAIIRVSTNGNDWSEFQIFPDLEVPTNNSATTTNPALIWLDISSVAANQNTVYLQWQWTGEDEWGWALDDVRLYSSHPVYEKAIWGLGTNEGRFENGLTGWTSNLLNGTDDAWAWTAGGGFGMAASANIGHYLSAPSALDGAVSYNADFYETGGMEMPGPFDFYSCELISPIIDLSSADKLLNLQFAQSVRMLDKRPGYPYHTAFAYSMDGGSSWSDWFNANPGVPINSYYTPEISKFPLPAEVLGVSAFRIKFLYAGNLYCWTIDDILITERNNYDLAAQSNFYAVNPSLQTPISAVSPIQFLFDIRNDGALPQSNTRGYVEIKDKGDGQIVFRDTVELGTIQPDELIENIQFPGSYLPDQIGTFSGKYFLNGDGFDSNPSNDTLRWEFVINDSIFAKELSYTGAFTPIDTKDFSYGNCFYIPPGPAQKACKVTFGINNPQQLITRKVSILTYELPAGDADGDLEIAPSEYNQISFNEYTFTGLEGDQITAPIAFDGTTIELKPDTYYAVLIRYATNNPVNDPACFIYASQQYDLQATYVLYDLLDDPRYFSMLDLDNTGTFSVIGLGESGFDQIPVVRLHLCNNTTSTKDLISDFPLKLYPNPVSDKLFVSSDFSLLDRLLIMDINGRKIWETTQFSSAAKQLEINVGHLSTGIYFLGVYNKDGQIAFRKFVRVQAK
ncbi:MAG: T9SS type A sorting domain-containing protein [Bacteroidetes bacterium]|nr:T9SS type A sorting domain-containing protein [Bacteroidota bacterium]